MFNLNPAAVSQQGVGVYFCFRLPDERRVTSDRFNDCSLSPPPKVEPIGKELSPTAAEIVRYVKRLTLLLDDFVYISSNRGREITDGGVMHDSTADCPTVHIVDDDDGVRQSLGGICEANHIPARLFASAEMFLSNVDRNSSGCAVIDLQMPGMGGLELQCALSELGINLPVILISGRAHVPDAVAALKAGAVDFLEKPFEERRLLETVRTAFELDTRRRATQTVFDRVETLTAREREVMLLLVEGVTGTQAAAKLGIRHRTVETIRTGIMKKMQAESVAGLTAMVLRSGAISQPEHEQARHY